MVPSVHGTVGIVSSGLGNGAVGEACRDWRIGWKCDNRGVVKAFKASYWVITVSNVVAAPFSLALFTVGYFTVCISRTVLTCTVSFSGGQVWGAGAVGE